MRNVFKIAGIKIEGLGIEIGEIKIESEYSVAEVTTVAKLTRDFVSELPAMVKEVGEAVKVAEEIDEEIENLMHAAQQRRIARRYKEQNEEEERVQEAVARALSLAKETQI